MTSLYKSVLQSSSRGFLRLLIFLPFLFVSLFFIFNLHKQTNNKDASVHYVAVGDSYTIGLGVEEQERWPNMLVDKLNTVRKDTKVTLTANLAVSGYTVEDAILYELPEFTPLKPDFATLLIGANDNFAQTDPEIFRKNLIRLLDGMQSSLSHPKNIVILTLPDHTKAPGWQLISSDKWKDTESISLYNTIIKFEARKRGLLVADIYPISQTLTDIRYFVSDGLHPSHEGYKAWTNIIFKQAERMIHSIRK